MSPPDGVNRPRFPILAKRALAPEIQMFAVSAPRVARKQRPGQFVIVRLYERGERIPLTIADADPAAGTVTLVVQGVGKTTRLLNRLEPGDAILDVVGPLGRPSAIERYGTVAVVAGGVGAAIVWPTARALRAAGNRVLAVLGARSAALLILEEQLRAASDELWVATDDGSRGRRGLVTEVLGELVAGGAGSRPDLVFAVGPLVMMRAVAEATRPAGIPTVASLNSIMVDGTGMCGGCRVLVSGENRFACVDGPEFDAHQVDFDALLRRNAAYRQAEAAALAAFEATPERDLAEARGACRARDLAEPAEGPA
jgi:ferredoxin--NADP+ reductase